MIYALVMAAMFGLFSVPYYLMAQGTKRHKAIMDAHDREFAKYDWHVPINARGPALDYAFMWGHIAAGVAFLIYGLLL